MHPYNLLSRVNSPATNNARTTPGNPNTPISRLLVPAVLKSQQPSAILQLDHVIGTTTKNPTGLTSCANSGTFAYCAGSVAVLAQVHVDGSVSRRYYRARPAAVPINPSASVYTTPTATPTRRRRPLVTPRKDFDSPGSSRPLLEDENARTWTARERIKSIKSVALSPNGRFLAIGETGYNPRVLLFSTARDASCEAPLAIINEHTWGVKSVAFSPDGQYLATLGESNDGFLFLWAINQRTGAVRLCATNKCTTNVCHMIWCGQNLMTVGTRHVKVWQLPNAGKFSPSKASRLRNTAEASPSVYPTPLGGRNCLLGDLAHLTFTCAVAVSDHVAVICTDIGSLCLVDVNKTPAELTPLKYDLGSTRAMGFRQQPQRLVWAGGGDEIVELRLDDVYQQASLEEEQNPSVRPGFNRTTSAPAPTVPRRSTLRQSLGLSHVPQAGVVAVACLTNHTVSIDADSSLTLSCSDDDSAILSNPRSSHNEPVHGVQPLHYEAGLGAFYTWSKNGEVRFWNSDASLARVERIELDEGSDLEDAVNNELKTLRYSSNGVFISGDRFGVLKLTQCHDWSLIHMARAHSAEVNDIALDPSSEYVATCSRDRMVQVFQQDGHSLNLIQTTDDHIAAVNQVAFSNDGLSLLSCSSDRTIVVREKVSRGEGKDTVVAFLQIRIITIKASPLSMSLAPEKDNLIYVSALDKHVTKIDFVTGSILESFKVADGDFDDHAVLNGIRVVANTALSGSRPLLIACSSTDKSVRVYDLQKQALLCKESAHTEGVSDIALLDDASNTGFSARHSFVSTGHDGTIMIWSITANSSLALTPAVELTQEQAFSTQESENVPVKASPALLPPLRRMLTKVDIAEFSKEVSAKSPSLRAASPVRLKKKGSRSDLNLTTKKKTNENTGPSLVRRASADDKAKDERRSPSPPSYATRRHKKPAPRGQISKDFFTRQSEWLRRSPSPQETPKSTSRKVEQTHKMPKLRRPPSVPTDLRSRTTTQERRPSSSTPNEFGSLSMATESTCRMLKTYKKKLQSVQDTGDLAEIEAELESVLDVVRNAEKQRKSGYNVPKRSSSVTGPRLRRQATWTSSLRSPQERQESSSPTGSDIASPESGGSRNSSSIEKDTKLRSISGPGLGVEGLSVLMERTNLAGF